jgi:hypothetical protein
MKNLKLALLSIFLIALSFTSCTNDEPVIEPQNIEDSQSITTSLAQLKTQFNSEGNITPTNNPAGNIVFDFCFDFVYPINLSYNNGATVTVNNLDGLIDIMVASTNELYINGIAFPFDVETFDNNTNSIVIETIENEEEFVELLLSCNFDDTVGCPEVYDPVCVEVTDPNGLTFTITYTNACYALEDGFTENDFIDDCSNDFYAGGLFDCFSINFPVDLITEDGEIITINTEEEFYNAIYNLYTFDFVYPFTITIAENDSEESIVINNETEFETILENCYNNSDCYDIYAPVCVEVIDSNGEITIVTYDNDCYALLDGFTPNDFVDCGTIECTEDDIASILTACPWALSFNNDDLYIYQFNTDGTFEVTIENNSVTTGTWFIIDTATDVFFIPMNAESPNFDDEWEISGCNGQNFFAYSLALGPDGAVIESTCDDGNNTTECTEENISALLVECDFWSADIDGQTYTYMFSSDGTIEVNLNNDFITSGIWNTVPLGPGIIGVSIDTDSENFANGWLFTDCGNPNGPTIESSEISITNITPSCN